MGSPESQSPIKDLEKPSFTSAIPAHLVSRLTDQERYLVETLSRMEQQTGWLMTNVLAIHKIAVDLDNRVRSLEEWRKILTGKWAIAVWIVTVTAPILLKLVFEWVFKKAP